MKKVLTTFLLAVAAWMPMAGQSVNYTPPLKTIALSSDGGVTFQPSTSSSSVFIGSSTATPPYFVPMCSATGLPPFSQCTFGGGATTFDQIGSGTNVGHGLVVGSGSVLSTAAGGFINANEINGVLLSGLATGPLCNTTTTGVPTICAGGAVSSVSNSDSTLTISPTTGAVVASLNLANPNTWTGQQTLQSDTSANPGFFTELTSTNSGSTAGLPSGAACMIQHGYYSGTAPALYSAIATCAVPGSNQLDVYTSSPHALGSESYNVNYFLYSAGIGMAVYGSLTSIGTLQANANSTVVGSESAATYKTNTNCSSSASPAVCASAAAGSVAVAATATTVVVNTSAVTANSQIQLTFDSSLGTKLGVTCNTTASLPVVSARVAGTSFTVATIAPVTNPACISYNITN